MDTPLVITPKTKVMQLLDAYPALESLLIETIPAFEKLRNPVLRKTVVRITSLQQAASIGNVEVEVLINTYITTKPTWFDKERFAMELDARSMLAAGEHPVNQVMADLATLDQGAIYALTTPFLPAPLIDKATSIGISHWVDKQSETLFTIYYCRMAAK